MKVKFVKDTPVAKAGATLAGPEVWRWAFPCKGCAAVAVDSEAANRIDREISLADPGVRARLARTMHEAGTLPEQVAVPPGAGPTIPVLVVGPAKKAEPEGIEEPPVKKG